MARSAGQYAISYVSSYVNWLDLYQRRWINPSRSTLVRHASSYLSTPLLTIERASGLRGEEALAVGEEKG